MNIASRSAAYCYYHSTGQQYRYNTSGTAVGCCTSGFRSALAGGRSLAGLRAKGSGARGRAGQLSSDSSQGRGECARARGSEATRARVAGERGRQKVRASRVQNLQFTRVLSDFSALLPRFRARLLRRPATLCVIATAVRRRPS